MANERMFLLHRPSEKMIMLGKHLGQEWYGPPEHNELAAFYDSVYKICVEQGLSNDDFVLCLESTLCRGIDTDNSKGIGCGEKIGV